MTGSRGPVGWWRRRSLRLRLTAVATTALVLGLVAGAVLLTSVLAGRLAAGIQASANDRARQVAAGYDVAQLQGLPRAAALLPDRGDGVLVQVQDAAGRVVAATPAALRLAPLPVDRSFVADPGSGVPVQLAVVELPGGRVVAAAPATGVAEGARAVGVALVVGVVVLGGVAGLACWTLVGLALRPVEALRRSAAAVHPGQPAPTLPVPAVQDEIGRLAGTLDLMLRRLDRAAERQRRFVADAAHELRSPLAGARAELEVALRAGDDEQWREVASDVLAEVLRLGRLVEDLLVLARVDALGTEPGQQVKRVDLGDAVAAVIARAQAAGARVPVSLVREVAAGRPPQAEVRPDALARCLRNLLDNAIRAAKTRVTVTVRRRGNQALVLVHDDGPGVPPQARERVFERFARLDDARGRDEGGTGLGLPIARELARADGGDVELEPDGPGATFRVSLPLADEPSPARQRGNGSRSGA